MGMFSKMLKEAQAEAEKMIQAKLSEAMGGGATTTTSSTKTNASGTPPTRWEKAIVAMNGIVNQVATIDPDGVDVVCFGGSDGPDFYRNLKDTQGLEAMVTAKGEPTGNCHMGQAMEMVLKEAFERGFTERPCSILVLTAGKPDDAEALTAAIQDAAAKVADIPPPEPKKGKASKQYAPLTITFVQVGDDTDAETYLKHLDDNLTTVSSTTGATVDIVDTIKDEEIQKAMKEMKGGSGKGAATGGALLGAFAGAAMGAGGLYVFNKINAKKRTAGWNGKWKATFEGDEIGILTVKDDQKGALEIEGFPGEEDEPGKTTGSYSTASGEEAGYSIQFLEASTGEQVIGTVEDEHNISWSDGTHWEEIPPEGTDWKAYMGAAAAGASAAGATGGLLGKKFFDKASHNVASDYVILLDRSGMMAVPDTGK